MRYISVNLHAVMDYLMGILLIAGPYLFELKGDDPQSMVLYLFGGALLIYSALTNYPLGLIKVIPMKVHLTMDIISGILLAASPWIMGFADTIFLPYLILGIVEILAGISSKTYPGQPTPVNIAGQEKVDNI